MANGFGASVVPRRLHAGSDPQNLVRIPFGNPVDTRQLTLIRHLDRPRTRLYSAIKTIFIDLPTA